MLEIQSDDQGRFVYAIEGEPPAHSYWGNRANSDLIATDHFTIPDWAPPLAVEDSHRAHWAFMTEFVRAHYESRDPNYDDALVGLAGCLWSWRLPVGFDDIWPMLLAHGWPPELYAESRAKLDFSLEVLRATVGKRPIKRRRLRPFEAWQYQPSRRLS